jgi:hypothetical protein
VSRLAPVIPHACSGCFQQKLGARHVDFDVAYDGPSMMNPQGGHQPIDDLILCEDCLLEAGRHVGLGPVEEHEAREVAAKEAAALAESRARDAEARLAAMESAIQTLNLRVPTSSAKTDGAPTPAGRRAGKQGAGGRS